MEEVEGADVVVVGVVAELPPHAAIASAEVTSRPISRAGGWVLLLCIGMAPFWDCLGWQGGSRNLPAPCGRGSSVCVGVLQKDAA